MKNFSPPLKIVFLFSLAGAVFAAEACGSSDSSTTGGGDASADSSSQTGQDGSVGNTGDSGGGNTGTDGSMTTGTDDGGGDAGSSMVDGALIAPYLETLKPNDAGTLTITWTNEETDCDNVEGWRKDALDPYAVVFTVSGQTTAQDDPGATGNFNYTYKLRCKRGADYSPYSFEESANPHN
jgi:hypothetical protein